MPAFSTAWSPDADTGERACLVLRPIASDLTSALYGDAMKSNIYHNLMGAVVPIAVSLLEAGLCTETGCQPHACARLNLWPAAPRPREAPLRVLLEFFFRGANMSVTLQHDESLPSAYLWRCDASLPAGCAVGPLHQRRFGADNCLENCLRKGVAMSAGVRLLGRLAGLERMGVPWPATRLPPAGASTSARWTVLLIEPDSCAEAGETKVHLHKSICMSARSAKLQQAMIHLRLAGANVVIKKFGSLPLHAQLEAWHGSQVIVSRHGAACVNMMFARAGATLVEMTPYLKGNSVAEMRSRQQLLPIARRMYRSMALALQLQWVGVPTAGSLELSKTARYAPV
jgi:hypothetical protein